MAKSKTYTQEYYKRAVIYSDEAKKRARLLGDEYLQREFGAEAFYVKDALDVRDAYANGYESGLLAGKLAGLKEAKAIAERCAEHGEAEREIQQLIEAEQEQQK